MKLKNWFEVYSNAWIELIVCIIRIVTFDLYSPNWTLRYVIWIALKKLKQRAGRNTKDLEDIISDYESSHIKNN